MVDLHEVFVRAEVGQGNCCMLYRVLLKVALYGFQQERGNLFLYEFVSKGLVKAQICEVSAALAVIIDIFGVF